MEVIKYYWEIRKELFYIFISFWVINLFCTYMDEFTFYGNVLISLIVALITVLCMLIICPVVIWVVDKFYE